jgi:AcrR family transcriptional regulator
MSTLGGVNRPSSLVSEHPDVGARLGPASDGQRARLLDAVARVVAEKGYAACTVADIVRAAGVSRSTFYEQFEGKEACFLEAFRHGVDVLDDRVGAAVREAAAGDWRAQLRAGIRTWLETLSAEPQFARTYLLELATAGEGARQARADAIRRFAERYAATAATAGHKPPLDVLLLVTAGSEQLAAERVRTRGAESLLDLLDPVYASVEAVILGAD